MAPYDHYYTSELMVPEVYALLGAAIKMMIVVRVGPWNKWYSSNDDEEEARKCYLAEKPIT